MARSTLHLRETGRDHGIRSDSHVGELDSLSASDSEDMTDPPGTDRRMDGEFHLPPELLTLEQLADDSPFRNLAGYVWLECPPDPPADQQIGAEKLKGRLSRAREEDHDEMVYGQL